MEETKKIHNLVTLTGIVVNMYETPTCKVATIAISLPIRHKDGSFNIVSKSLSLELSNCVGIFTGFSTTRR